MSWVAASIIGGSVISGVLGSNASQSAANTQAGAANNATAAELQMYSTTAANVAPWLTAGQTSLKDLTAGVQPGGAYYQTPYTPFQPGDLSKDPGYQFTLDQGINALTNKASIGGGLNSNNLKGLVGYAQGNASTYYQQALQNYLAQWQAQNQGKQQQFANVSGISALGEGAALQQGQIGANVGQTIGSNIIGAGNAQAAGTVGSTNAITGAMSSGYNQWLQQQYLNNMTTPNTTDPFSPYYAGNYGGGVSTPGGYAGAAY